MDLNFKGRIGQVAEVRRSEAELYLEWTIPYFLDLSSGGDDYYDSFGTFSFCDACWHMRVYPDWDSTGWVALGLHRDDSGTSTKTLNVSVGMRGSDGVIEERREVEREFGQYGAWGVSNFCSRSTLKEQKERLMQGHAITVTCEMKVPVTTRGASSCPDLPLPTDTETGQTNALTCKCQSLDKQGQQSSDECDICCERPIDCALDPCGHMSWCYDCSLKFWEEDSPCCPLCRKSIQRVLKIYR